MTDQKILILGNGQNILRAIQWVLEYKGYQVKVAASPEDAIEALVKKNYDLIIAKLSLDDVDNLEVLIRAKKLNPGVKVMVISDGHDVTFPLEAYRIEVDDYLLMPVSPTELWRRFSQCLEPVVDLKAVEATATIPVTPMSHPGLDQVMLMLHDVRGSMVSIAASLKLILRGTYGATVPRVSTKLQEIYDRVNKLTNLADEFMHEAIAAKGSTETGTEILDLRRDVIDPVLAELAPEMENRQITIDHCLDSFSPDPIPVKGNKLTLRSVFRNLLSNGIKHGDPGCCIKIGLESHGAICRLNVCNTGKPIQEKYRALLFSEQTSMNRKGKEHRTGLGMGLYLSRDIIKNRGGDIWYEAKADGSNFVISLPRN